MTYTEDRETFERDIFKPPYLARMLDVCGEFTGRLSVYDREKFIEAAMTKMWESRLAITCAQDIMKLWVTSLEDVALSRPYWVVSTSFAGVKTGEKTVRGKHLRVKP